MHITSVELGQAAELTKREDLWTALCVVSRAMSDAQAASTTFHGIVKLGLPAESEVGTVGRISRDNVSVI